MDSHKSYLPIALILTFSTGIADAVGYLALDRVFTGNMTGNVVILGMGILGSDGLPVVGPILSLLGFMVGAAIGGRVLSRSPKGTWTHQTTSLVVTVGILFGIGAIVLGSSTVALGSVLAYVLTTLLAMAMGLQAAVARRLAVADVTTVVVTSTITSLAADSRLGASTGQPWIRRGAAIVLIAAGAFVGASLLSVATWLAVATPALLTLSVSLFGHRATAHSRS
jgi:uncharacterized membrane protein YoaK (UPF0700 family)